MTEYKKYDNKVIVPDFQKPQDENKNLINRVDVNIGLSNIEKLTDLVNRRDIPPGLYDELRLKTTELVKALEQNNPHKKTNNIL